MIFSGINRCKKANHIYPIDIHKKCCSSKKSFDYVRLPEEARVVICGGGVLGSAVAYHLCELGWGEHTVILEKGM